MSDIIEKFKEKSKRGKKKEVETTDADDVIEVDSDM
jgi:hypothetical protein